MFTIDYSTIESRPDVAVLAFKGELDTSTLPEVETLMNPLLENAAVMYVVFDLHELNYMNSRAVGMLMNFYGVLKERGRSLILVGLQDGVQDTLSLVGVTQLVPVHAQLDDFMASLSS